MSDSESLWSEEEIFCDSCGEYNDTIEVNPNDGIVTCVDCKLHQCNNDECMIIPMSSGSDNLYVCKECIGKRIIRSRRTSSVSVPQKTKSSQNSLTIHEKIYQQMARQNKQNAENERRRREQNNHSRDQQIYSNNRYDTFVEL